MTSIHLQKILKSLRIQESSRSKNSTEYYLSTKEYFATFFSTLKHIPQNEKNR